VKLKTLRRQYEFLSINDKETVSYYFNRLQVLLNLIQACDESIGDNKIFEKGASISNSLI